MIVNSAEEKEKIILPPSAIFISFKSNSHMSENWVRAAAIGDIEDEDLPQVKIDDLLIAIYNLGGTYYATSDICTHEHACLSDGSVIGGVIECPLHQGCFDIATGKAKGAPVTVDLQNYPTRIDGENIFILR